MRSMLIFACLALLVASVPPAAADVTVDHEFDSMGCRGTNGVYGPWGEAWFGSGSTYASSSCRLFIVVYT